MLSAQISTVMAMRTLASQEAVLSSCFADSAITCHVSKLSSQKEGAAGQNASAVGGSLPARGLI